MITSKIPFETIKSVLSKKHLRLELSPELIVFIGRDPQKGLSLLVRFQQEFIVSRPIDGMFRESQMAEPLPMPPLATKEDVEFFFNKEDLSYYFRGEDFETVERASDLDRISNAGPGPIDEPDSIGNFVELSAVAKPFIMTTHNNIKITEIGEPNPKTDHLELDHSDKGKKLISFRIEEKYIEKAKQIAESKGLGYQTLFRMWIVEQLSKY